MKNTIVFIKLISLTVIAISVMLLFISCSDNQSKMDILSSNVPINWENVNKSIESTDISDYSYYIESEYKTTQEEYNYVSLHNYDPDDLDAWKNTDYQLDISYGENFKLNVSNGMYDYVTILISLYETGGDGYYAAAYTPKGEFIDQEGTWFISEAKDKYMEQRIADAQKIFGIT